MNVKLDLIKIIFLFAAFNPMKRLTVEEALQQPYLEEYYDPADEPVAGKPFEYEFEIDDLPTNTLKELVFLEVVKFKKL